MSLASSAHAVRELIKTFEGLIAIGEALDDVVILEAKAKTAEKRANDAVMELGKANAAKAAVLADVAKLKAEADVALASAKADAAAIRKEAKEKADVAVQKGKEKADAIAEANATAMEKFTLQKQTNDEVLAMANAQIAHAEAKLSEIRTAIAKITGV